LSPVRLDNTQSCLNIYGFTRLLSVETASAVDIVPFYNAMKYEIVADTTSWPAASFLCLRMQPMLQ